MKFTSYIAALLVVGYLTLGSLDFGCSAGLTGSQLINRRSDFFKNTTIRLSEDKVKLLSPFLPPSKRLTHLPYWFDFEQFKAIFGKSYPDENEERARHDAYISTCIRVIKARVLYRILAGTHDAYITSNADKLPGEKALELGKFNLVESATTKTQEKDIDGIGVNILFKPTVVVDETPIMRAVRLMTEELNKVESRNQLVNYLKAFESDESPFIREN